MESPEVDCEALMNAALPFAQKMLKTSGEFYPYGTAMRANKSVVSVTNHHDQERPQSGDVIAGLKKAFIEGGESGDYIATALVYDVRIILPSDGTKSDAIAVALDHRENYSVVVFLPYKVENGAVTMGEPLAQRGEGEVFSAS